MTILYLRPDPSQRYRGFDKPLDTLPGPQTSAKVFTRRFTRHSANRSGTLSFSNPLWEKILEKTRITFIYLIILPLPNKVK